MTEFNKEFYLAIQDVFLEKLIDKTPVGETGETGASWDIKFKKNEVICFNTNGEIIYYLEEGTKPHTITPLNKKALAFDIGGVGVVTKVVKHPGTKALKFINSIMQDQSNWNAVFDRIGVKFLDKEIKFN